MDKVVTALIAIISGVVASVLTASVSRWFEKRNQDRFTVEKYSRPIWLACRLLRFRLVHIVEKLKDPDGNAAKVLNWQGDAAGRGITWMNGYGYFITSTAYLLSTVSSWFHIVDRKVIFLPFQNQSIADQFLRLVTSVKQDLTTNTSLWFHYYAGLGQMLLDKEENQPMTFGQFVLRLNNDFEFRQYFDQLFYGFLHETGEGRDTTQIEKAIASLEALLLFLSEYAGLPSAESTTKGGIA
jgi:hypothetical protein